MDLLTALEHGHNLNGLLDLFGRVSFHQQQLCAQARPNASGPTCAIRPLAIATVCAR